MVITSSSMFLFPTASSLLVTIMSIINLLSLTAAGYMEMSGKNKQYAKFCDSNASKNPKDDKNFHLKSKNGMLLFYTPSYVVAIASLAIFPHQNLRFLMVLYAITIHFFKRIVEVMFVHKFSGSMMLDAATTIGLSYAVSISTVIYAQYLSMEFPEPCMDLKYIGLAMFLVGIVGNFYHHYILSNLRKNGDKAYKIPKGGLFDLVICPHYLFEIVGFIGVLCIAQTMSMFCYTLGTIFLLMGRSHATRKWYVSKFGEKFPKDVKAIIPHLF
uniref:very-long-chain enoyl-CoA reductase-like n=1 Tax=Erigeron canadensis TaxID=72917 RepID=UPI001CB95381|nr:very-long-chain enoyl-CoA reductase-like [Erigeron canadensis]